jgi:nucleoside-diphosphate-sugar epimerase
MLNILLTGGAGFIGRWVARKLAEENSVFIIDDLSNGSEFNISEFRHKLSGFAIGDVSNREFLNQLFRVRHFDACVHAAAQISVQKSIDDPQRTFQVNTLGTFNLLEEARMHEVKIVLISTCMVYDTSRTAEPINEECSLRPRSPYASSKLAADFLALSYYHAYGLPVVVARPFNVYGPFQKGDAEGGVVSVFIRRVLDGEDVVVFGDGKQTRDFTYVEDCADFVLRCLYSKEAVGEIINSGVGRDIAIRDLADLIAGGSAGVRYGQHPHPQSEIGRLVCDASKAKRLLDWEAHVSLEEGIAMTKDWMARHGRR